MSKTFIFNESGNLLWPSYDHNPIKNLHKLKQGLAVLEDLIDVCDPKRCVVQAGGHAGMFAMRLSRSFKTVLAFEPEPVLYKCLVTNTQNNTNVLTFRSAIGDALGVARMRPTRTAGTWRIEEGPDGTVDVPMTTVDAACRDDVDALVLDVEGYEVHAMRGAAQTIQRCHPIIQVEMLPRAKDAIERHMADIGYKVYRDYGTDRIYESVEKAHTPWR